MAFWMFVIVTIVSMVVGELLRPKPKFGENRPSSLGDFDFPTADQSRSIPVFCGTCKFDGPNTAWFGDLRSEAITKKVKTGLFSSDRITQGHKYFLGVQVFFAFGPMDELIDFRLDNKTVLNNISVNQDANQCVFVMNKPTLLGNDDPNNGVSGKVRLYKGTRTQPQNEYLRSKWGEVEASAFRPLIYAVFEQCYLGNTDTPPPPSLIARRCPNTLGLSGGMENIDGDANPAAWCYEVMTDDVWGLKIPTSQINIESFKAAAETLFNEGMGVSMKVETATPGRDVLAEVLRHIDGIIFPDPQSGLYEMKLARDDYDVNALELFDNANILPDSFEISRTSWEDTKNTIIVNFVDRDEDYTVQPVQYQDGANVFVRGGQITSESIDFLSFTKRANALAAAARASKVRGSPLARVQFATDRTGYALRPGQVIKLSKPDYGINNAIMRVIEVNYGTLDEPKITVVCTEDIFAINAFAYGTPEDTGWVPVYAASQPLRMFRVVEAPFELNDAETRRLMALAVRNDFVTEGFEAWLDTTGSGTSYKMTNVARGTLAGGLVRGTFDELTSSLVVEAVTDSHLVKAVTTAERNAGAAMLLVNDEFIAYETVSVSPVDGAITLGGLLRGLFDTVPAAHSAGSQVYFFNSTAPLVDTATLSSNASVLVKLPTFNGRSSLALADVAAQTVTPVGRAYKPNPVATLTINGTAQTGPNPLTTFGECELSWNWRNKTFQSRLVAQWDNDIPREPGSGVRIQVVQGAKTLELEYTEGRPVWFKLSTSGLTYVYVWSKDFDGELSRYSRVMALNYTSDGSGEEYIRDALPEDDGIPPVTIYPSGGVLTIDCTFSEFIVELTENCTANFINVPESHVNIMEVRQHGSFNITWPPNVNFLAGTPYVVTPGNGAINMVGTVTLNSGGTWNLKASQPGGSGEAGVALVVSADDTTPSGSNSGSAGSPVTATTNTCTLTVSNATAPYTVSWARTDNNGGTNFTISPNATSEAVTWSNTSSVSSNITQQWTVTVTDNDDKVGSTTVSVSLATTNAGFTASASPNPAYGYGEYPTMPTTSTTVTATGANPKSYYWTRIGTSGGTEFQISNRSAASPTWSRNAQALNVSRTQTWQCTVTDTVTNAQVIVQVEVTLETGTNA